MIRMVIMIVDIIGFGGDDKDDDDEEDVRATPITHPSCYVSSSLPLMSLSTKTLMLDFLGNLVFSSARAFCGEAQVVSTVKLGLINVHLVSPALIGTKDPKILPTWPIYQPDIFDQKPEGFY